MRLAIAAFLFAMIASLGGVGYWYIHRLEKKVVSLSEENGTLKVQLQQESANTDQALKAVEAIKSEVENFGKTLQELKDADEKSRAEVDQISQILAKHNLTYLSSKKPGLVQRRINDSTSRVIRLLECASRVADTNCDSTSQENEPASATGSSPDKPPSR